MEGGFFLTWTCLFPGATLNSFPPVTGSPEIHDAQVEALLHAEGRLTGVRSHKDLGGIERVVEAHLQGN